MKHLQNFMEYIKESFYEIEKKSDKFSLQYSIILLYRYLYPDNVEKFLGIKSDEDLSEILNIAFHSISMTMSNFKNIDKNSDRTGFSHRGNNLEIAFYTHFDNMESELRKIVLEILDQIENGKTNKDFLSMNKLVEKPVLSLDDKKKIKSEFIKNKLQKKLELENILKDYIYEIGEIVTLKHKDWRENRDFTVTKDGKNPSFKQINGPIELDTFIKKNYEIIFPHKLGEEYSNIKVNLL